MSDSSPTHSGLAGRLRRLWARLAPIFSAAVVAVFLYWAWTYREAIATTFRKLGIQGFVVLTAVILVTLILTVSALVILVRDKGYGFRFSDAYHSLNISQLASMIPGGIWGYAGFAGVLWSKGISKADSAVIVFFHSVLMLSSCAVVGFSGLAALLGWSYAAVILLPGLFLLAGRNGLDRLRKRLFPETSPLPSTAAALKVLALGILIWTITAGAFAGVLYRSEGFGAIPILTITGAFAAAYLGGYVAVFAPSGLGVSEGLVALMLGPYVGAASVLGIAISFRIVQTLVTWCNIAATVVIISRGKLQTRR